MVYELNPLEDGRWQEFVRTHPAGSIFHTREWIEALHLVYGYEPVAFTTSPPREALTNAVLLCRVESWLTGRRLVSLPFSDHCDLLVEHKVDRDDLLATVRSRADAKRLDYLELRPRDLTWWNETMMATGASFVLHTLDLRPSLERLLHGFHRDTILRKIRRAEREQLVHEQGSSDRLLRSFYMLTVLTRKRHGLPPPPFGWFRALARCLGDRLTIRLASKDGRPIGSILTLQHGTTLVYKYGCSDARRHNLGAMPFLFWQTISDAKENGIETLDLGRSDSDNPGLIRFKERLGATSSALTYLRYSRRSEGRSRNRSVNGITKAIAARLPAPVMIAAGRMLYRHMG